MGWVILVIIGLILIIYGKCKEKNLKKLILEYKKLDHVMFSTNNIESDILKISFIKQNALTKEEVYEKFINKKIKYIKKIETVINDDKTFYNKVQFKNNDFISFGRVLFSIGLILFVLMMILGFSEYPALVKQESKLLVLELKFEQNENELKQLLKTKTDIKEKAELEKKIEQYKNELNYEISIYNSKLELSKYYNKNFWSRAIGFGYFISEVEVNDLKYYQYGLDNKELKKCDDKELNLCYKKFYFFFSSTSFEAK